MSDLYDYSIWPNFTKEELICSFTGKENPNVKEFTKLMNAVQVIRTDLGIPFEVASAYRSPEHPIEVKKKKGGMHTYAAIDIRVPIVYYHKLICKAVELGFTGIGVNCKGPSDERFLHLDFRPKDMARLWSY